MFAQSSANIVGTVRDTSGAIVPGAQVSVLNTQTGYTQARQSDADGTYKLPLLPVGQYQLTVEKQGFQKYVQTGIALAVNDNANIDVTMTVGALSEAVTVTGAAPLVETQSGTIKGLVDQQRIVDLPLNGRDITQLMSIQAGVISRGWWLLRMSPSTFSAADVLSGACVRLAQASTRVSAPSSSRMLSVIDVAMNSITSSGTVIVSFSAFL
jgi:hypothetical protein